MNHALVQDHSLTKLNNAFGVMLSGILPLQLNNINPTFTERTSAIMYNEWMVGIMLAGPSLRTLLKLHFNHPTMAQLCISNEALKINDQMKEICNVLAGTLKTNLEKAGFQVGISLPFVASGLDEYLFSEIRKPQTLFNAYNVINDNKPIMTFTLEMELLDKNLIGGLDNLADIILAANQGATSDDDDGMEML